MISLEAGFLEEHSVVFTVNPLLAWALARYLLKVIANPKEY
jgi:hypothetical protein